MSLEDRNLPKTLPKTLQKRINDLTIDSKLEHNPSQKTENKNKLKQSIKKLLLQKNAQIVAHYYVDSELQQLADETGGKVADSLDMAYFGSQSKVDVLVVCGVKFMGETAKILSPEKKIFMPNIEATCSLDLGCTAKDFSEFCAKYPDHKVVVYANTSAEIKAMADWVVTSGNALEIVSYLKSQGKKIIWAPDKHLGRWIQSQTGIEMVLWKGHCVVHDEFNAFELELLKQQFPESKILAHPESPESVIAMSDIVGSTKVLINAVKTINVDKFIVATDKGIFYKMQQAAPHKTLIIAPTNSKESQCKVCASCPWMAMNSLENLEKCLNNGTGEILVDETVRQQAKKSIDKMLNFSYSQKLVSQKI